MPELARQVDGTATATVRTLEHGRHELPIACRRVVEPGDALTGRAGESSHQLGWRQHESIWTCTSSIIRPDSGGDVHNETDELTAV